jgi:hypothetical protein
MNLETKKVDIKSLIENEDNPRIIKHDKFMKLVQSIKDFPEMLEARPIVVNKDMVIIGGNMRYNACLEAGLTEVPICVTDFTPQQEKEFIIKDNSSFGEWDFAELKQKWETSKLDAWGVDNWNVTATQFEPNVNPNTNYKDITSDDIDKKQDSLNSQYDGKNNEKRIVVCPHCLEDFEIDK